MGLRSVSLGELYAGWTIGFSVLFTPVALSVSPRDLRSLAQHLATAAGLASVFGSWFSIAMWLGLKAG